MLIVFVSIFIYVMVRIFCLASCPDVGEDEDDDFFDAVDEDEGGTDETFDFKTTSATAQT